MTITPPDLALGQDDDLPYDPFIDKQLESQRSHESSAVRDLGRTRMDMIVGLPPEVRNSIKVTKNIASEGEKPVVILVYGRKETVRRQVDISEDLQRKEVERQAFNEGLRDSGIQVRGDIQTHKQPEALTQK